MKKIVSLVLLAAALLLAGTTSAQEKGIQTDLYAVEWLAPNIVRVVANQYGVKGTSLYSFGNALAEGIKSLSQLYSERYIIEEITPITCALGWGNSPTKELLLKVRKK